MVREKTIGIMLGYVSAIFIIVLCALIGFYSLEYSVISFIILSYVIWLAILLVHFLTKPLKILPFCQSLSAPEVKAYQKYHLYLSKPDVSALLSLLVNLLRIAALGWSALAIWVELYWLSGFCIVYFFMTAGLTKKLNPWLKLGNKAEKGNKVATKQLYLVDIVQMKMNKYKEERAN